MRNQKLLLLEQLDRKLLSFKEVDKIPVPQKGWIHNIRNTLNITLEQLGNKLDMTKQGVKKIEEREASGSISIKTLKEIAQALDMKLVYGFVPKYGSIEKTVEIKAEQLARKIVLRTNQNMRLENQGNSEEQIAKAIEELAIELKQEMRKSLWD